MTRLAIAILLATQAASPPLLRDITATSGIAWRGSRIHNTLAHSGKPPEAQP